MAGTTDARIANGIGKAVSQKPEQLNILTMVDGQAKASAIITMAEVDSPMAKVEIKVEMIGGKA